MCIFVFTCMSTLQFAVLQYHSYLFLRENDDYLAELEKLKTYSFIMSIQ